MDEIVRNDNIADSTKPEETYLSIRSYVLTRRDRSMLRSIRQW